MAENFDKHIEAQYLNKPFFVQLKRVYRAVKRAPGQDKPKKFGFYKQLIRKVLGNAETNEKIVRDIIADKQEISPKDFIGRVFSYEIPLGKKLYLKPETAYQTTQRLVPSQKLNKTISVSAFGDIYDEILKKYTKDPEVDELIRTVNRNLSGHFTDAATFVRWTNMSPKWIHIDAFQTDFFNQVKSLANKNPKFKEMAGDFRKMEEDFFKTAVSYIVRTHPGVKIWTASSADIVKKIEGMRGDVKAWELYRRLPKKLGFREITLDKLLQILGTRPGKETNKLKKKFGGAIKKVGKETDKVTRSTVDNALKIVATNIAERVKSAKTKEISKEYIDQFLTSASRGNPNLNRALHQILDSTHEFINKRIKEKATITATGIRVFLFTKKDSVFKDANIGGLEGAVKLWWANRGMIFESTRYENRMLAEKIKGLAGM